MAHANKCIKNYSILYAVFRGKMGQWDEVSTKLIKWYHAKKNTGYLRCFTDQA